MTAPFAEARGPATQAVGGGALEETTLVTRWPEIAPVKLREAEKSTTDKAKHKLTWHLHGRSGRSDCGRALYGGRP